MDAGVSPGNRPDGYFLLVDFMKGFFKFTADGSFARLKLIAGKVSPVILNDELDD